MKRKDSFGRREFLKSTAGIVGTATQVGAWSSAAEAELQQSASVAAGVKSSVAPQTIDFPRTFTGEHLKTIAFPLGGVAAGSLSLGGRGQLRDWEIFNRPNKGFAPSYCFPSIRVQYGNKKPIARVLEGRILPPYDGQEGLGSNNVPGLSRLAETEFIGAYPLARLCFHDSQLPVEAELEAFSPFIPHDPEGSGLPVAILRYRVRNPQPMTAEVSIAFSIDNPVKSAQTDRANPKADTRANEHRASEALEGISMSNPALASDDPMRGTFVLTALRDSSARITNWRGWPKSRWWNAPMFFWDTFSLNGELADESPDFGTVGALCVQRSVAPSSTATFTFILAWHFPNRTPDWCGWTAPKGEGKTVIGNHYCTRFTDAWDAAQYATSHLDQLEARTRAFAQALAESSLPATVKDAASANLSTLASTVCFRTADGEFHGFEGANDHLGCCFGNCTHVWNYETATAYLFPSYARSLRNAAFGYSMDEEGGMRFRQLLPDGKERFNTAAADGQMGQILHAYIDWKLSGDTQWLKEMWPRVKKAIEFAWIKKGWDPGQIGVMTGVQHNTYDIEFFGPNPFCSLYYLGALRASDEMAHAVGDASATSLYRPIFEQGSRWVDEHLFQGEFYIQQIRGYSADEIASQLRAGMGGADTKDPQFQVGSGCLADQLIGQYLAAVAGLGPLVSPHNIRTTMESIYRYNYKPTLVDHECVQRTYALNEEGALMVCDYGKGERPRVPFPYFAEAWTGTEYLVASLLFYVGMIEEGIHVVTSARARYDGRKRNPWDEEECGHHYARAMSSWSTVVMLSGFHYAGDRAEVTVMPRQPGPTFRSFWSTGTGWGTFSLERHSKGAMLQIQVISGELTCTTCIVAGPGMQASARFNTKTYPLRVEQEDKKAKLHFPETLTMTEGMRIEIEVKA